MLTRRSALFAVLFGPMAAGIHSSTAAPKGTFNGRVVAEWLGDGRKMRLVEPFEFIGPDARRWPVPAGTVVDGASIPQVFWSLIGGPFEGPYRNASVIHDYYCDLRTRRFRDVHRMFYDGMLASGVGDRRARLMYEAVDRFGPTWADPKIDAKCEVINEKYDFEKCAKNWRKPSVAIPGAGREELLRFAAEVEGTADAADIATLRRAIAEIK